MDLVGALCGRHRLGGLGSRRGQTMVEYTIVLVVVLTLISLLTLMLYAVRQNGDRALDLVASEYP